jgi:hypothetical protein
MDTREPLGPTENKGEGSTIKSGFVRRATPELEITSTLSAVFAK